MSDKKPPLPMFDSLEYIDKAIIKKSKHVDINDNDFYHALAFLKCYKGSLGTFNSHRRETERLLQWCKHIANITLKETRSEHIEEYIRFCQNPPKSWIGIKKVPRFLEKDGERCPNSEWRPFVITISKAAHRKGKQINIEDFELSQGVVKELFAILSTFFNYLIQEEYVFMNPVALIRQKGGILRFVSQAHTLTAH